MKSSHEMISEFLADHRFDRLPAAVVHEARRALMDTLGCIIIPAAMAAAEMKDCSGSRFIEAIVVGYELGLRVGMASNLGDIYYGSAFGGAFGATAAFGWILGLGPEQMIQALGITEMHAPNSMFMGWIESRQIPMIKEGMGWAAASGVIGALMAQTGITGTLTIFNGREKSVGLDGLGRDYEIKRRYYKPQPGCRWTHAPTRILMNLLAEYKLSAADVAGVEVRTFDKAAKLDNQKPSSMEDAQYSIPFVLGSILAEGQFGPHQMRQDQLDSPHILKQAGKISLKVEPAFSKLYPALAKCEVVLKTKSGRMVSSDADNVQGDWDLPLSDAELKDKFVWFTRNRLNAGQLETVLHHMGSIEAASSVGEFIKALNHAIISD